MIKMPVACFIFQISNKLLLLMQINWLCCPVFWCIKDDLLGKVIGSKKSIFYFVIISSICVVSTNCSCLWCWNECKCHNINKYIWQQEREGGLTTWQHSQSHFIFRCDIIHHTSCSPAQPYREGLFFWTCSLF